MFTPSNTKYMLQKTKPNKHQLKSEMQKKTGGYVWSKHHFLDTGEVHKEEITFQGVELICCFLCIYLLWCTAVRSFKQIIKRPKPVLLFKRNWTFFWICFTQLLLHSSLLKTKETTFLGVGFIYFLYFSLLMNHSDTKLLRINQLREGFTKKVAVILDFVQITSPPPHNLDSLYHFFERQKTSI